MEIENKEYIEELLSSLVTDPNARQKLLQLFATKMYREAQLYISDKETAKEICRKAYSHAYSSLNNAKAEDVWPVLQKAIQDECIRTITIDESGTVYTSDDEVPDDETFTPENTEKVYSALRKLLRYLNETQRLIAVLKYRDGLSFSTIADKLNITEKQTKGILQDAKNTLQDANINMGLVFAMVRKLFPYYNASEQEESEPFLEERYSSVNREELTEEERFTKTLEEIEVYFETAEIEKNREAENTDDKRQIMLITNRNRSNKRRNVLMNPYIG